MFGNIIPMILIFIGTILLKIKIKIKKWKWVGGGELDLSAAHL